MCQARQKKLMHHPDGEPLRDNRKLSAEPAVSEIASPIASPNG
jgi:hypothetical protein